MQQSLMKLNKTYVCLSIHSPANLYHNMKCKCSIQQYIYCTMYPIWCTLYMQLHACRALGIFWVDSQSLHLNYCILNGLSKSRYWLWQFIYMPLLIYVIYAFVFSDYWISCTMHIALAANCFNELLLWCCYIVFLTATMFLHPECTGARWTFSSEIIQLNITQAVHL